MVALVDGVPQTLGLKSILEIYLRHRMEVIIKRSSFELEKAKAKAHILEGYLIALDHIDEVISLIKKSKNEQEAKKGLVERFNLTPIQAQAILDMPLKRLTALEREKIEGELTTLRELIAYLLSLLKDIFQVLKVIKEELLYLKEKYGDERRTQIIKTKPGEITDEQLIENKEVIVVLTKEGYIKQVPRETFRVQNRGGKGVSGMETKESDNVYFITSAMTHDYMLFFSNFGRVFQSRVWDIPVGSRVSKGKAIVNLLSLKEGEKITSVLVYDKTILEEKEKYFVLMVTKKGIVKKTPFSQYLDIRSNGIIAIKLEPSDELLWVKLTDGKKMVILVSSLGKAIIFKEEEVRITGRSSIGVKGMEIVDNDFVVSADVFSEEEFNKEILVIGEHGIGKKTSLSFFKDQHRGGKGIKIAEVDEKFGRVAFSQIIKEDDKTVIITSRQGQVVKIPLSEIPSRSRAAKGVILMRFSQKNDRVASAAFV